MKIVPSYSVHAELKLLGRIASAVFSRSHSEVHIHPRLVLNLGTLLLGMLRAYATSRKVRVREDWVLDILGIYQSLLERIEDASSHVPFLVRLFGPATHSLSLFNASTVRRQLVSVLGTLSKHPSTHGLLASSYAAMANVTAEDMGMIGGRDFARCMPVFQALSGDGASARQQPTTVATVEAGLASATATAAASVQQGCLSWSQLLGPGLQRRASAQGRRGRGVSSQAYASDLPRSKRRRSSSNLSVTSVASDSATRVGDPPSTAAVGSSDSLTGPRNVAMHAAVLYEAVRCMYDDELVVRTAAAAALRKLVEECISWSSSPLPTPSSTSSKASGKDGRKRGAGDDGASDAGDCAWLSAVLQSILMPAVRRGIKQSSDVIKKGFVLLLAHIIRSISAAAATTTTTASISSDPHALVHTARLGDNYYGSGDDHRRHDDAHDDDDDHGDTFTAVAAISHSQKQRMVLHLPADMDLAATFHTDLAPLLRDDAEQDFFENVAHIQMHRRVRALMRLKLALNKSPTQGTLGPATATATVAVKGSGDDVHDDDLELQTSEAAAMKSDNEDDTCNEEMKETAVVADAGAADIQSQSQPLNIQPASFVHVVLPMCYHFLISEEFKKKDHLALLQESAALLGAAGRHLAWNHYVAAIKTLLRQLDKGSAEKEKMLLNALCALLDGFHFDLKGDEAALLNALSLPNVATTIDEGTAIEEDGTGLSGSGRGSGGRAVRKESSSRPRGGGRGLAGGDEGSDADADAGSVSSHDDEGEDQQREPVDADEEPVEERRATELGSGAPVKPAVDEDAPSPAAKDSPVAIAQTLVNSILPWVQRFLIKNVKDHKGNKSQVVQPQVAVALTKLVRRLEAPVVAPAYRDNLFLSLVLRVVNTLKSKDSSSRDVSRNCLAQMVQTMGMEAGALRVVLQELQHILTEGFQRHVCNYSVRSILRTVLEGYLPPCDAPSVPFELLGQQAADVARVVQPVVPAFDQCIPLIMQSVLDDLAGEAQEDREADGALRSLIREAKGSKANDVLEITARCLLFRPTYALLAMLPTSTGAGAGSGADNRNRSAGGDGDGDVEDLDGEDDGGEEEENDEDAGGRGRATANKDPASISSIHALASPLLEALPAASVPGAHAHGGDRARG